MKPRYSKITVTPADYLTGGSACLAKPWVISYYYFDDLNPKGKQIRIKGMNNAATLAERRDITKDLINNEKKLLSKGYNPVTHKMPAVTGADITENTFFIEALKRANDAILCEHQVRLDIKSVVKRIERHATAANMLITPISEIRRRDIVKLLDMCLTVDKISPNRYNVTKNYLSILYRYLAAREIVETNFIRDIQNIKQIKRIRKIITIDERQKLYELKETNYTFFRFIEIFFASGSRVTELLKLQAKDCDLTKQEFTVLIKKGAFAKEEIKPIASDVLPYWQELIQIAAPDQYIFSDGLIPGNNSIRREQITRRWRLWCKHKTKGLGIESDMYTLKHAHLDDIANTVGMNSARDLAGHTDSRTTRIYTHLEKQRRIDELKHVKVKL
jgi:site-specific recombinase XerD